MGIKDGRDAATNIHNYIQEKNKVNLESVLIKQGFKENAQA